MILKPEAEIDKMFGTKQYCVFDIEKSYDIENAKY